MPSVSVDPEHHSAALAILDREQRDNPLSGTDRRFFGWLNGVAYGFVAAAALVGLAGGVIALDLGGVQDPPGALVLLAAFVAPALEPPPGQGWTAPVTPEGLLPFVHRTQPGIVFACGAWTTLLGFMYLCLHRPRCSEERLRMVARLQVEQAIESVAASALGTAGPHAEDSLRWTGVPRTAVGNGFRVDAFGVSLEHRRVAPARCRRGADRGVGVMSTGDDPPEFAIACTRTAPAQRDALSKDLCAALMDGLPPPRRNKEFLKTYQKIKRAAES